MNNSLEGIKVLDFSTLLPGPLASLFLAETGAEVIKIEDLKLVMRSEHLIQNGVVKALLFQCLTVEKKV